MRNIYRIALVSVLAFSLAAASSELYAQTSRSTTTTTGRSTSSSTNKSSAATSATPARSTAATASRSAGTSASRQTTNTNSSSRAATTPNTSSSSQVRRSNGNTTTSRGTTSTSTGRSTTGSTSAVSGSTARRQVNTGNASTSGSTASRSTTATTPSRSTTATTPSRSTTSTGSSASRTVTTARPATTGTTGEQNVNTGRVSRNNATSSRGLTAAPAAVDPARAAEAQAATSANKASRGNAPQVNYSGANMGNMRMDGDRNLNRIPPRERDFMTYDKPGSFFAPAPHFFGYRVQTLPPRYRRISHWGIDYYYYDNIYYRRYGSVYVVCRPPFGVAIDIALRDLSFASVRFAYYHNVYRTFDVLDDNYRTIAEQNRIIAQNNAKIASQNASLALNAGRASSAYEIANALGLVQSYANIDKEYFYQDGVFYVVNGKNRYEVIVPPAGALVNELPDDYDIIVLNGVEYYKVDDTVYRLVLVDGVPALEVLGQMYGDMARKYNYYYN